MPQILVNPSRRKFLTDFSALATASLLLPISRTQVASGVAPRSTTISYPLILGQCIPVVASTSAAKILHVEIDNIVDLRFLVTFAFISREALSIKFILRYLDAANKPLEMDPETHLTEYTFREELESKPPAFPGSGNGISGPTRWNRVRNRYGPDGDHLRADLVARWELRIEDEY